MTQHCVCNTWHPWHVLNHVLLQSTNNHHSRKHVFARTAALLLPNPKPGKPRSHTTTSTPSTLRKHTVPRCNHLSLVYVL